MSEPTRTGRRFSPPEWLWLGVAVERARAERTAASDVGREELVRARAAAELAGRALEPVEPLDAGPGKWLAVVLYREALYFALAAQPELAEAGEPARAATLSELWALAPAALLEIAAGGADAVGSLRAAALDKPASASAKDELETQDADARLLRAAVERLLLRRSGPERRIAALLLQRWLRTGALAAAVLALVIGIALAASHVVAAEDVALGKPWRTSSTSDVCNPEKRRCAGARTRIFFHTKTEDNPWLEIDLLRPETIAALEVENRDNCCPDRALPLVVETSGDREQWSELVRRTETFYTWRTEFAPRAARYVRLRVPRKTALHLVRVSLYRR